jgi:predicted nucleic acid-binding protein
MLQKYPPNNAENSNNSNKMLPLENASQRCPKGRNASETPRLRHRVKRKHSRSSPKSTDCKRKALQQWFEEGLQRLRVLDLDSGTASVWAALLIRLKKKGQAMPVKDSLIAASALQHQLTIVTRNIGDFRNVGVPLMNPFD